MHAFRILLFILFIILSSAILYAAPSSNKITIVIDAGHGGHDTGAIGAGGILEKNVVLNITKKLAKNLSENKNIRVVLTRNGDYFIPLYERIKLARKYNADLFVSIHADAYFDQTARGASVYRLSTRGASTLMGKWLAQRENHTELDNINLNNLKDRSPMLRSVLIDLALTKTSEDSLRLGDRLLDGLDGVTKLHYKTVERAPFLVLKSPDIPSVLVETGFISNSYEEKKLADPAYQTRLAAALKQGIDAYVKKYYR